MRIYISQAPQAALPGTPITDVDSRYCADIRFDEAGVSSLHGFVGIAAPGRTEYEAAYAAHEFFVQGMLEGVLEYD